MQSYLRQGVHALYCTVLPGGELLQLNELGRRRRRERRGDGEVGGCRVVDTMAAEVTVRVPRAAR